MNLFWWLILAGLLGLFIYIKIKFKVPKTGSLTLVTGGVKTGKSCVSLYMAYSDYRKRVRRIKFVNFFRKLFKKDLLELPLFYSNIPVSVPYVSFVEDLLLRKKRFVYGSVAWIDEASLMADSLMFRDAELSELINLFNKLIGHSTKGGAIYYNTQSIHDLHNGIKKCVDKYFYIHHLSKWIPFFLVANIREMTYSYDGDAINVYNEDVEESLKKVLIPKSIFKKYDCYCYSILTDNLPVVDNVVIADTLKSDKIISFRCAKEDINKNKGVGGYKKYAKKNYTKFK